MILIDPPQVVARGRRWSHLISDESFDELREFADRLGLPRRAFERDHYDVPEDRYQQIVAAGAVPVRSRDLVSRLSRAGLRRRKSTLLTPRPVGRSLLRPRRLVHGDRIAVVGMSGPVPVDMLGAGVEVLESWGLSVDVHADVLTTHPRFPYLAGVDEVRAAAFTAAWEDSDVAAIAFARGGYGIARSLPYLDFDRLSGGRPKLVVGFSDVTALHQALASRLGMGSVHGPVVTQLGASGAETRRRLRALLFEPETVSEVLGPEPVRVVSVGHASGVLVGGNLRVLCAEVSTPTAQPSQYSIVVLEDVAEQPYKIDQMLTQLHRSGWLDKASAIVLGSFRDCGDPDLLDEVFDDRLGRLGIPVISGFACGHDDPNLAFPLGVRATLSTTPPSLRLAQPGLTVC